MPTTDHTPPGGADDPVVDALWKAHRRRMLDIAFRILLDLGDAEDVVQEAFSRLAHTDIAAIDDPGPPASPTLLHLPVGDRAGIVALRDHRVLALVLLTIEDGLVAHVHALAGPSPRAAVTAILGLP